MIRYSDLAPTELAYIARIRLFLPYLQPNDPQQLLRDSYSILARQLRRRRTTPISIPLIIMAPATTESVQHVVDQVVEKLPQKLKPENTETPVEVPAETAAVQVPEATTVTDGPVETTEKTNGHTNGTTVSDPAEEELPKVNTGHKEPLKLSGALDQYAAFDVTPVIGREFPEASLAEWLKAPNSDELIRDLAITSKSLACAWAGAVLIATSFSLSPWSCLLPQAG